MNTQKPPAWQPDDEPWQLRRWVLLVLLLGLGATLGTVLYLQWRAKQRESVVASEGRLTLAQDDGGHRKVIDRQAKPEVWYRVTLEQAPVGSTLTLTCEWIGPDGKVHRTNHYETRQIDKPNWPTHARCQFGPESPVGPWRVRLLLDDRVLYEVGFEVVDGGKKE